MFPDIIQTVRQNSVLGSCSPYCISVWFWTCGKCVCLCV